MIVLDLIPSTQLSLELQGSVIEGSGTLRYWVEAKFEHSESLKSTFLSPEEHRVVFRDEFRAGFLRNFGDDTFKLLFEYLQWAFTGVGHVDQMAQETDAREQDIRRVTGLTKSDRILWTVRQDSELRQSVFNDCWQKSLHGGLGGFTDEPQWDEVGSQLRRLQMYQGMHQYGSSWFDSIGGVGDQTFWNLFKVAAFFDVTSLLERLSDLVVETIKGCSDGRAMQEAFGMSRDEVSTFSVEDEDFKPTDYADLPAPFNFPEGGAAANISFWLELVFSKLTEFEHIIVVLESSSRFLSLLDLEKYQISKQDPRSLVDMLVDTVSQDSTRARRLSQATSEMVLLDRVYQFCFVSNLALISKRGSTPLAPMSSFVEEIYHLQQRKSEVTRGKPKGMRQEDEDIQKLSARLYAQLFKEHHEWSLWITVKQEGRILTPEKSSDEWTYSVSTDSEVSTSIFNAHLFHAHVSCVLETTGDCGTVLDPDIENLTLPRSQFSVLVSRLDSDEGEREDTWNLSDSQGILRLRLRMKAQN